MTQARGGMISGGCEISWLEYGVRLVLRGSRKTSDLISADQLAWFNKLHDVFCLTSSHSAGEMSLVMVTQNHYCNDVIS